MIHIPPDKERLGKLDLTGIKIGDTILFCPKCDFQIVNAGLKVECPIGCFNKYDGKRHPVHLHITNVDEDLINLKVK